MDNDVNEADADQIAYDQLLWIWAEANPAVHVPGQCAGCGKPMASVMELPDGARVCLLDDYRCLIAYGTGRQNRAVKALAEIGVYPPEAWELS